MAERAGSSPSLAVVIAVCGLGVATFSAMDAAMKGVSLALGAYNATLWRSLFCVLIGGAAMIATRNPAPTAALLRLHVIRGVLGAIMAPLFFWALIRLPLAEAIALSFIAPLIALVLASVFLRERIARGAMLGAIVGFAGVLVILGGQLRGDYTPEMFLGVAAILVAALLFAITLVIQRHQAQSCSPVEIAFFYNLVVLCVMAPAAPWLASVPAAGVVPLIAAAGVLQFVSLLCLSWAYARAEAQKLIPLEYTAFIWAALLGWLIFEEAVSWFTLAGTALIVVGCLLAARSERKPGREPAVSAA